MRTTGTSVPDAVREIVTGNRSIYDCIRMDLINYTALAVKIRPAVEQMLGSSVNLNTVVVAIKRYADSFEDKRDVEEESVLKNARLILTDGMMDIRFSAEEFDRMGPAEMLDRFARMGSDYDLFRHSNSFRLFAEDMKSVREIFNDMRGGSSEIFSTGLAKIRIVIPDATYQSSDVVSHVAKVLHTARIEMINVYFGQSDVIVIVREKDAARAYDVLRSSITHV